MEKDEFKELVTGTGSGGDLAQDLMFDEVLNRFYRYTGAGVWKEISKKTVARRIIKKLGDQATRDRVQDKMYLLGCLCLVTDKELFKNDLLLNIKNGMLDATTRELKPHHRDYHSRLQMNVNFDKQARCELWIKTLGEIFADDPTKIDVLQQFFGYCLYPKILFPGVLFQVGGGANGKGVVEEVLSAMLGREHVSHISMERLQKEFGPLEIKDKLLNSCGENDAWALNVAHFEYLAAGGEIRAQCKYRDDVEFVPIAKHMITMNAFPELPFAHALYSRVIVLEYNQNFEGPDLDVNLADKLLKELDGIFMWALAGLTVVLENKRILTPDEAKERFRKTAKLTLID